MNGSNRRVMGIVLTHNAPEALEKCVWAIAGQTTPPEALLVVDNASVPAVEPGSLPGGDLPTQVIRSEHNTGPAGGYALALREFLASGFEHAWLLDDDMHPEAECLERLWALAEKEPETAYVFPVSRQPDGSLSWWFSWCGLILSRQIVEAAGVPMAELFWWAEDTEYLQYRIPQLGYRQRVATDAVVNHVGIRHGDGVPLWKYYYESRNMLYVHLHVKRRIGRYPQNMAKLLGRALLREKYGRLRRLAVMARGVADGARGRLGIRYPVAPMREQIR